MRFKWVRFVLIAGALTSLLPAGFGQQARADPPGAAPTHSPFANEALDASASQEIASEGFAVHGQATFVEQVTAPFHAPYRGPNSLSSGQGAETFDMTLFGGARLWSGAEAWINPEIDQGFGLDGTLGLAGFPSGEAYKVGKNEPYLRLQRLFVRESLDLDGDREAIEAGANQLAGS